MAKVLRPLPAELQYRPGFRSKSFFPEAQSLLAVDIVPSSNLRQHFWFPPEKYGRPRFTPGLGVTTRPNQRVSVPKKTQKWIHREVIEATVVSIVGASLVVSASFGEMTLRDVEFDPPIVHPPFQGQTVELHFLEQKGKAGVKKIVVDALEIDPLSPEETARIFDNAKL